MKSRNIRRLIFASHDDDLVSGFRKAIEGCGIEVRSLTDVGLPEPSGSNRGLLHSAARKAAVVAAITNTPAIGWSWRQYDRACKLLLRAGLIEVPAGAARNIGMGSYFKR